MTTPDPVAFNAATLIYDMVVLRGGEWGVENKYPVHSGVRLQDIHERLIPGLALELVRIIGYEREAKRLRRKRRKKA